MWESHQRHKHTTIETRPGCSSLHSTAQTCLPEARLSKQPPYHTLLLYSYFFLTEVTTGHIVQLYSLTALLLTRKEAPRGQQPFGFVNLDSVHTRWAFDEPWASAGPEQDRTDSQRGHRISSRSLAGPVFNIDLFTITLPVCAFHSRLNTNQASLTRPCVCCLKESLQWSFLSLFFCAKKKKRPKKVTHFKCFTN